MTLRDALFLSGTACVVAGFSMWSLPAGFIALGVILLYLGLVYEWDY